MQDVRVAFAGKVRKFFAFFCLRLGVGWWVSAVVSPSNPRGNFRLLRARLRYYSTYSRVVLTTQYAKQIRLVLAVQCNPPNHKGRGSAELKNSELLWSSIESPPHSLLIFPANFSRPLGRYRTPSTAEP